MVEVVKIRTSRHCNSYKCNNVLVVVVDGGFLEKVEGFDIETGAIVIEILKLIKSMKSIHLSML